MALIRPVLAVALVAILFALMPSNEVSTLRDIFKDICTK